MILRRPWLRQPNLSGLVPSRTLRAVDIITPSWIGRGGALLGSTNTRIRASRWGLGWTSGGSNSDGFTNTSFVQPNNTEANETQVFIFWLDAIANANIVCLSGTMTLSVVSGVYKLQGSKQYDAGSWEISLGAPSIGYHVVVASVYGSFNVRQPVAFYDGNAIEVSGLTGVPRHGNQTVWRYLTRGSDSGQFINGGLLAHAVIRPAVNSAMTAVLARNPWLIFEPSVLILPMHGGSSVSSPTLSDLRAINVTDSSTQWSIDYAF